jgi:hypothetical protein
MIFQIHFSWKIAFRQICNKLLILLAVPTAPMRRTLKIRTPGKSTEPQKKKTLERTSSLSGVRGSASAKPTTSDSTLIGGVWRTEAFGANAMPNRLLAVLGHQAFALGLGLLVFEIDSSGAREDGGELGPGIR